MIARMTIYFPIFLIASRGFPDTHGSVEAAGCDKAPIRGPGGGSDAERVTMISEDSSACRGIPHTHGLIITGRDDVLAVRRPGCGGERTGMFAICEQELAALRVPYVGKVLTAEKNIAFSRHQARAIGRPGQRADGLVVSEREDGRRGARIPELCARILAGGGDERAIGRPGHSGHRRVVAGIGYDPCATGR